MITTTLQQIIDKRISLPKPETNRDENKQQVNESFHIQIHAMRFVDKENVETIILPKKTLMKNSKYVHEGDRLFVEQYGLKGRPGNGSIFSWEEGGNGGANTRYMIPTNIAFLIKKSPSYFVCCKCATKLANYYALIGRNPKSPTQIISICDIRYSEQYNTRRRRNKRR